MAKEFAASRCRRGSCCLLSLAEYSQLGKMIALAAAPTLNLTLFCRLSQLMLLEGLAVSLVVRFESVAGHHGRLVSSNPLQSRLLAPISRKSQK